VRGALSSAQRIGSVELFSIAASVHHAPGPAHHASFWRPEGVLGGHAAGAISSNGAGSATTYATAADRRLLAPGPHASAELSSALERLVGAREGRRAATT
jgi:hypothetical protein